MWVLRAIVGLVSLAMAIATVPVWFERPLTVLFTMIFAVLGLWAMGWVSWLSPKKKLEDNASKEQEIRQSKYFGLRNRIMGALALLLGSLGLVIAYQSNWQIGLKPLGGLVFFVLLGAWYTFKGRNAE